MDYWFLILVIIILIALPLDPLSRFVMAITFITNGIILMSIGIAVAKEAKKLEAAEKTKETFETPVLPVTDDYLNLDAPAPKFVQKMPHIDHTYIPRSQRYNRNVNYRVRAGELANKGRTTARGYDIARRFLEADRVMEPTTPWWEETTEMPYGY